jgi:hypothetical protein
MPAGAGGTPALPEAPEALRAAHFPHYAPKFFSATSQFTTFQNAFT